MYTIIYNIIYLGYNKIGKKYNKYDENRKEY